MSEPIEPMIEGPRSAEDLVSLYDKLSVPHFQRGLVWDSRSVALLLESLYEDTPCGAVILWAAPDAAVKGVALGRSPRFLIVDGQQRIRSLYGVLRGDEAQGDVLSAVVQPEDQEAGDDEPENDLIENHPVWCFNLGQVAALRHDFPGGGRHRLFRLARDPRIDEQNDQGSDLHGAPLQDREALLPLKWFLANDDARLRELVSLDENRSLARATCAVLSRPEVNARLRDMMRRPAFHVSVVDAERSLAEVVGIYNRINSSGKKVESEERAFASLVSAFHDAPSYLEAFFDSVHPRAKDAKSDPEDLTRDSLLTRQREGSFGFKLFMRVFGIVLCYHSARSIGSSSFSFKALTADALREATGDVPRLLKDTVDVLKSTAELLRRVVYCDDFRMLPDTDSLWPVFQLLTRFPDIGAALEPRLGSIVLRLVIGDLKKRDLLRMCADLNRAQSGDEALALFAEHRLLRTSAFEKAVKDALDDAQAITSRATMVLYWLLRRHAARDFLYDPNLAEKAAALKRKYGGVEPMLSKAVKPERQHIVPYMQLKVLFELEDGSRPGRHDPHDIGNLTYISQGLNGFVLGVGSQPLKLDSEEPTNREAHCLPDELLGPYQRLVARDWGDLDRAKGRALLRDYRHFCSIRRKRIQHRIVEWERELRETPSAVTADVAPAIRRVRPQLDDRIRQMGYPKAVTEALVNLCVGGRPLPEKEGGALRVSLQRRNGRGRAQLLRVDVQSSGGAVGVRLRDVALRERFVRRYPELQNAMTGNGKLALEVNEFTATALTGILDWLTLQISRDAEGAERQR